MKKHKKILSPFVLPGFAGILIFYVLPFGESLYYAVTSGVANREFAGLYNFRELIGNPSFQLAVSNTFLFMGIGVAVLMPLSLVAGYMLAGRSYKGILTMLLLPMVLPPASFLPGVREIFREGGMFDSFLYMLGLPHTDYLQEWAFGILLFVYVIRNIGFLTIILQGAIAQIPIEFSELYRMEKKIGVGYLTRVVVPLIRPAFSFSLLLAVMGSLKIFRETWLLYGNFPPLNVYMLQYFMNNNFQKLNYQRLSGAAVLVVAVLTVLIMFVLYRGNKRERAW